MSNQDKIIVGISIGDLNGIGSEIVLKTFQDPRMLEFCTPVIFASVKVLSFFKKHYNIELNLHGIDTLDKIIPKKINVLNLWKEAVDIDFGKQDNTIGRPIVLSCFPKSMSTASFHRLRTLIFFGIILSKVSIPWRLSSML